MTGFSSEWLNLREPVDHSARSSEILSAVAHYFSKDECLRVTDFGCGTGSTVRALKPILHNKLEWHLIDNDDALLADAQKNLGTESTTYSRHDLSRAIDGLFEQNPSLITTSAFLDLVSQNWLVSLCNEIVRHETPFYAALSYDGRTRCTPPHIHDEKVITAFNRHQGTDKGFGAALGPNAANAAVSVFRKAGYLVTTAQSDWETDQRHLQFQRLLLDGWRNAAKEMEPQSSTCFDNWYNDRIRLLENGNSQIMVGHLDFFAVPQK